jgi:hypothetical protein
MRAGENTEQTEITEQTESFSGIVPVVPYSQRPSRLRLYEYVSRVILRVLPGF